MKKIPLFPLPLSWLSAVLLYAFLNLWIAFVAVVLPRLVAVGEESPRLAILGYLAVWVSPIAFVAVGHHVVHLILDRADRSAAKGRGLLPDLTSWWAGVFAWLVIVFASSVVMFLLAALHPPEQGSVSLLAQVVQVFAWPLGGGSAGLHTLAWVLVAAKLYDMDHAVKSRTRVEA